LNLVFGKGDKRFQTPCTDLKIGKLIIEVKSVTKLKKIEVIDYESMKKLCKLSLEGINKSFKHTHTEKKGQVKVRIEMRQ